MNMHYTSLRFTFMTAFLSVLLGARCKSISTEEKTYLIDPPIIEHARSYPFDTASINETLALMSSSAHPFGSDRQAKMASKLFEKAVSYGWDSYTTAFKAKVPNPKATSLMTEEPLQLNVLGTNIIARPKDSSPCVILIGSHYDSKRMEGIHYLGANDSASSSSAIFWILEALESYKEDLACDFAGVWFDGEEAYLEGWNDGLFIHPAKTIDNTYGSRHFANNLVACDDKKPHCLKPEYGGGRIKALILLDLIGSPNIRLSEDLNSSERLVSLAKSLDKLLFGANKLFTDRFPSPIQDDHIPFVKLGIEAINFIDFENLEHWHNASDTADKISLDSIEKASRLSIALALTLSRRS